MRPNSMATDSTDCCRCTHLRWERYVACKEGNNKPQNAVLKEIQYWWEEQGWITNTAWLKDFP